MKTLHLLITVSITLFMLTGCDAQDTKNTRKEIVGPLTIPRAEIASKYGWNGDTFVAPIRAGFALALMSEGNMRVMGIPQDGMKAQRFEGVGKGFTFAGKDLQIGNIVFDGVFRWSDEAVILLEGCKMSKREGLPEFAKLHSAPKDSQPPSAKNPPEEISRDTGKAGEDHTQIVDGVTYRRYYIELSRSKDGAETHTVVGAMGQYVNNGDGALLSCEKVVSATGNTLTIRINGTDFRFTLTDSTPITEKGKKISIGDIKAGDVVTVTSKIGGRVATGISKHPMMSHVMTSVSSGSDADQKSTDYFLQQRQVFEKTRENNNNK